MCWGGKGPAFACANGTGTREPNELMTPDQVRSALPAEGSVQRIGNPGCVMDPPHIPTYSHDQEEHWAYYEYASFPERPPPGTGQRGFPRRARGVPQAGERLPQQPVVERLQRPRRRRGAAGFSQQLALRLVA